jgi:hypothetical protein
MHDESSSGELNWSSVQSTHPAVKVQGLNQKTNNKHLIADIRQEQERQ